MTATEAKINELYQELSQIDSENDVQLYAKVRNKLFSVTYAHYKERYGERVETEFGFRKELEYGEEVYKAVAESLVSFIHSPDAVFLHYLNTAVSRAIKSAKEADHKQNARAGIYVPRKTGKEASNITKDAEAEGRDPNSLSFQESCSRKYRVPLKKIKRYVEVANLHRAPTDLGDLDNDGNSDEIYSIFEIYNEPDEMPHDKILEIKEELKINLSALDSIWQKKQERVKERLSYLLTVQLLKEIRDQDGFLDTFIELYRSYEFLNSDVIDAFQNGADLPTQKEIASIFELDETQVSRDLKNIRRDLKKCQESK